VTGYTADLVDQLHDLGRRLPWMVLFVVAVTLVLLFAAFGSVVLPVKAVLMNVVSLGAAFGAVVFVFQQGHFASWLGYTATGFIEPTDPILMVAVLFGLSTDYEVFLLSRVREEWLAGADNTTAVAGGLQRTGRIITSAALLLIVVITGFVTGQTGFIKLIGVGMIVAIVVDATLVRALLVPATMRLLGRWNWWAPAPLRRLHRPRPAPGAEGADGPGGPGGPGGTSPTQQSTMIGA
jgi:RND superfamily putative drug exporter